MGKLGSDRSPSSSTHRGGRGPAPRSARLAVGSALALTLGAPAHADFLGILTGEVLDDVAFAIAAGDGDFVDSADTLDIAATANSITTQTPNTTTEIDGGAIEMNFDLASESLLFLGGGFFSYSATFNDRAGETDITLEAPTGGPAPEQDGRTLIEGELLANVLTISVGFTTASAGSSSFTLAGTFEVTGGDSVFQSTFGSSGDLADVFAASTSTSVPMATLLADGWLFSVRDTDLVACGGLTPGSSCPGSVVDQTGSFTFAGIGEIQPQSPGALVPEPGTLGLLALGLLALAVPRRAPRGSPGTPATHLQLQRSRGRFAR